MVAAGPSCGAEPTTETGARPGLCAVAEAGGGVTLRPEGGGIPRIDDTGATRRSCAEARVKPLGGPMESAARSATQSSPTFW